MLSYGLEERIEHTRTGEVWTRQYDMVNLAYTHDTVPDGEYKLTLTISDSLGNTYPPGTSRIYHKDYSTPYQSRSTLIDLTVCPAIRPADVLDAHGAHVQMNHSVARCGRCVRGVCVAGACLCEADWFGKACDADVHDTDVSVRASRAAILYVTCLIRTCDTSHAQCLT